MLLYTYKQTLQLHPYNLRKKLVEKIFFPLKQKSKRFILNTGKNGKKLIEDANI